jgi:integration host factor subunit beta
MNRESLIESVCKNSGLSKDEVKAALELMLDGISNELINGGRVELRGFGVFSTEIRKPRPARNPRSGETVWLEERRVATFKPARKLKSRVAETIQNN